MPAAAVDLDHLARYTGGDVALNSEILRLFDGQASELVQQLQGILEARDAKSWKLAIHTLKGAARGIGAFSLGDAAAAAEPIDPASDSKTASAAIQDLETKAGAVRAFIRTYLGA
jgi:HPt (histidine-containing phosphotransfer) domain-containing protein